MKKRLLKVKRLKSNLVALVDAEIVTYQVCTECMTEQRVGDDEYTWHVDMAMVRPNLQQRIENAAREIGAGEIVLAVGSKSNWRKRICETYKANRAGKKKPLGYWAAIEFLREHYRVDQLEWLEADDVLGILTTGEFAGRGVIVSNDKDMLTVPGRHYNPCEPEPRVREVSLQEADIEHAVLALAGDASDGYKGCKGVGEKGARMALLDADGYPESPAIWETALRLFEEASHDEAYAIQQFRLARVLRSGEYDKKTGELKLWTPPAPIKQSKKARK
jgi:5'-3' exonuclease